MIKLFFGYLYASPWDFLIFVVLLAAALLYIMSGQ